MEHYDGHGPYTDESDLNFYIIALDSVSDLPVEIMKSMLTT